MTALVQDERGIVNAVRSAREQGSTIRAAGSGGSKNGAYRTDGVVIRTDRLDELFVVSGRSVTVSPGMTCGRLNDLLRPYDLVVPGVGEWECATVGGSLATATHGGSATHGILAAAVQSLQFVDGEGRVHRLERGDADFNHVAVGLGTMGILSAVTLECVPRFDLRLDTDVIGFDEYARDPVAQETRAEFHASVWVPSARRVIRYAADRATGQRTEGGRQQRFGPRTGIANMLSRSLSLHSAVSARLVGGSCMADCASILSPISVAPRVVRWIWSIAGRLRAAELAFPADRAGEVLRALDDLGRAFPSSLGNPIGLRMNAADRFSLSPCHGRQTLWVDLFYRSGEQFDEALVALADKFDARCHWGKHLALPAASLRERYPMWNSFVEACRRYDPHQLFANSLTNTLALTGGA